MLETGDLNITRIPSCHTAVVLFKKSRHRIIEPVERENPVHGDYFISLFLFEGAPTVFVLSNPTLNAESLREHLSSISLGCETMELGHTSLIHQGEVEDYQSYGGYHQPVFPGHGIGVDSTGGVGTLGCYLKANNGQVYGLTTAHPMATLDPESLRETWAAGEKVSQPSLIDYKRSLVRRVKRWVYEIAAVRKAEVPTQNQLNTVKYAVNKIAALAVDIGFGKTTEINKINAVPWSEDSGWGGLYHYLDYALIECKPERIGSNRIANEIWVSEIARVTPCCKVTKHGRTSGWTTGTTTGVESIIFSRRCPNLHFAEHTVGPQRHHRDFTSCGDSGAAIIGKDEDDPSTLDKIVGISFGGGSTTKGSINCSTMTKIQIILEDIESSFQMKVELL